MALDTTSRWSAYPEFEEYCNSLRALKLALLKVEESQYQKSKKLIELSQGHEDLKVKLDDSKRRNRRAEGEAMSKLASMGVERTTSKKQQALKNKYGI